jgi:aspartate/methionine/tyrosine aminotransferase
MATFAKATSRITYATINENVKNASYAVRGPIVSRSMEINNALKANPGQKQFPFTKTVSCNIGNPYALGHKSVTFFRDVLSIVTNPGLLTRCSFPADTVARAKKYLSSIPDVGAYSESQGILAVREEVASFLKRRDGYDADPSSIFLTNGASEGVRFCMQTLLRDPASGFKDGVLTPIPQYPLYSALTTLLQGHLLPYYLDEANGWACASSFLTDALAKAQAEGIVARALVVINPGNPTGQLLPEQTMREIVAWCVARSRRCASPPAAPHRISHSSSFFFSFSRSLLCRCVDNGICLMADEVYQENIWKEGSKFVSFRKVAKDMNAFDEKGDGGGLQLISFHSVSKVRAHRYQRRR